MKDGILLLNLGSPDSLAVADVRTYLDEFLMDERVIDVPAWFRTFLVRGIILNTRPKQSAEAYEKIWTDEGSPLIATCRCLRDRLEESTGLSVFLGMRYRLPSTPDAVGQIKEAGIERLFIIPLYPHYSMSSYETAVVHAIDSMRKQDLDIPYEIMPPFYEDPGYIQALTQVASPFLDRDYDHLLFSFHGIPERHLRKSDPSHAHCLSCDNCCDLDHPAHATCYRHQCLSTVRALVDQLEIPPDRYSVSFQSRLGKDPWLQPYTDRTLESLPQAGKKRLLVMCPAFTADCLETLEEINMSGRESFLEAGGESFDMIPCLNDHAAWVDYLTSTVRAWQEAKPIGLTRQIQWFYRKPQTAA